MSDNNAPNGAEQVFQQLMANPDLIANVMTTRSDLMQKLFDPRRDIDDECGYPKIITDVQYRAMYDRELGRRVVNIYPEETWVENPKIYEDPDTENQTPFETDLERLENRHHLLHYLQRADELSGVGHYGIILWGLDDGLSLSQPVEGFETWEETTGKERTDYGATKRSIIYIRVLDESLVRVATYESDVTSPRYGMPLSYTITLHDPRNQESNATVLPPNTSETNVHWSRITHIADNRKTSEVMGTPRMEPVWNRLYDLRKVLGGSGEMFWRGGFPGISLETQPGLENASLDVEATRKMMYDYMNGLQRYLATTGMSAKSLAPQIANPTDSFEVHVKAICIILGCPYRVFVGMEEGVVAGDQASKTWYRRLGNRQERYVTPMIINVAIQRLVDYGVLSPPAESVGWTVEWGDLTPEDPVADAEVASKLMDALSKYIGGSVDNLIPPMSLFTEILGIPVGKAQAILEAAIEHIDAQSGGETLPPHGHEPEPEPEQVPAATQPRRAAAKE